MVLIIDFEKKKVMGNATAKDIRQLGLLQASRANRHNPFNHPEDITNWSSLFMDTDETSPDPNDQWQPEEGDDEEW